MVDKCPLSEVLVHHDGFVCEWHAGSIEKTSPRTSRSCRNRGACASTPWLDLGVQVDARFQGKVESHRRPVFPERGLRRVSATSVAVARIRMCLGFRPPIDTGLQFASELLGEKGFQSVVPVSRK